MRIIINGAGIAGPTLVALTGYGREEDRRRSQAAEFDLHLQKPIDPNALAECLLNRANAISEASLTR
jgi:CheY-like chemotaxis protein